MEMERNTSFKRKHDNDDDEDNEISKRSRSISDRSGNSDLVTKSKNTQNITLTEYSTIDKEDSYFNKKLDQNGENGDTFVEEMHFSRRDTTQSISVISPIHKQYLLDEARKLGLV
jgi:hypothetical protein